MSNTKKLSEWVCPKCGSVTLQINRPRDNSGHVIKHCGCRTPKTKGMTSQQLVEYRRQQQIDFKRKYRREAGAIPRVEIAARAAAKRDLKAQAQASKNLVVLHDAHVNRYARVIANRAKYKRRYQNDPYSEIDRQKRRKQALPDSYVIYNLKVAGVPAASINSKLIELKREAMEYHRISRSLKTAIKANWKENNEAITKHP